LVTEEGPIQSFCSDLLLIGPSIYIAYILPYGPTWLAQHTHAKNTVGWSMAHGPNLL
jgi:hypothetical protein